MAITDEPFKISMENCVDRYGIILPQIQLESPFYTTMTRAPEHRQRNRGVMNQLLPVAFKEDNKQ
jgi:hypothetical protein